MRRRIGRKAGSGAAHERLKDEVASAPAQAVVVKRVVAFQLEQAMTEKCISKAETARRMEPSRSQLNRLLDPDSESVALDTLARAAQAVGRRVSVELVSS